MLCLFMQTPCFVDAAAAMFMNFSQQDNRVSTYIKLYFFFPVWPGNPGARRDREPLYQSRVWYLGVISHVGHQLAKKCGPL